MIRIIIVTTKPWEQTIVELQFKCGVRGRDNSQYDAFFKKILKNEAKLYICHFQARCVILNSSLRTFGVSSGAPQASSSPLSTPGPRMLCPTAALLWWHLQMGGGQSHPGPSRGLGHLPGPVSEPLWCTGEKPKIALLWTSERLQAARTRCAGASFYTFLWSTFFKIKLFVVLLCEGFVSCNVQWNTVHCMKFRLSHFYYFTCDV